MAFRGCGRGQMSPQWANVIIKILETFVKERRGKTL